MPGDAAPQTTEVVHRPDEPGLARGVWEAPPFAFYLAFGAVCVFALAYFGYRVGLFRRGARRG